MSDDNDTQSEQASFAINDDDWKKADGDKYVLNLRALSWPAFEYVGMIVRTAGQDETKDATLCGTEITIRTLVGLPPKNCRIVVRKKRRFPWAALTAVVTPASLIAGTVCGALVTCSSARSTAGSARTAEVIQLVAARGCGDDVAECLKEKLRDAEAVQTQLAFCQATLEQFRLAASRLDWPCDIDAGAVACLGEVCTWRDRLARAIGCKVDETEAACVTSHVKAWEDVHKNPDDHAPAGSPSPTPGDAGVD